MLKRITPTIRLLASALLFVSAIQRSSAEDIVQQFYPTARLAPASEAAKRYCFQVRDVGAQGPPNRIVAAYTDLSSAVVRVLTRNPQETFEVTWESPVQPDLFGSSCEITLADVDGDGERDVFLELHDRGTAAWAFRWISSGLVNVNAELAGSVSHFGSGALLDVRHDGTLQVIGAMSPPGGEDERLAFSPRLYRFVGGRYTLDRPVLRAVEIPSTVGQTGIRTFFLLAEGSDGPYQLRVVNGDRNGLRRVTAGTIELNGRVVVADGQLTNQVEFLNVPLGSSLPVQSTLFVRLQGASDSLVTIVVEETDAQAALHANHTERLFYFPAIPNSLAVSR